MVQVNNKIKNEKDNTWFECYASDGDNKLFGIEEHCIYGKWYYFSFDDHVAILYGRKMTFTKKEFSILYCLADNYGKVISYRKLYEAVWKEEYFGDFNSIMAHIHRIRTKIRRKVPEIEFIHNVHGVGYKFQEKMQMDQFMESEVNDIRSETGKRMKRCRQGLGLDKRVIADALNVSLRTYEAMEEGNVEITIPNLVILEKCFAINSRFIITGRETPNYAKLSELINACPEEEKESLDRILFYISQLLKKECEGQ